MAIGGSGVVFSKGWERLTTTLNAKTLTRKLVRYVGKATRQNALDAKKTMKQTVRGKVNPPNRPLTLLLKKSSIPLIEDADLLKAITHDNVEWSLAYVGLFSTAASHARIDTVNLGFLLHQIENSKGVYLPVTAKMRKMFNILSLATNPSIPADKKPKLTGRAAEIFAKLKKGTQIYSLKPGTTTIRIPGRPFVFETARRPDLQRRIFGRWRDAVLDAMNPKTP